MKKLFKRVCSENNQLWKKKKEMTELKEEEHKSYLTDTNCHKCKDKFEDMDDRTVL